MVVGVSFARAPLREITEKDSAPSRLRCDHPVGMRETARRGCNVRGVKVLVSAIALALALAASAAAAPPAQQLLGTWTRTVTAADVQKAGATKVVGGQTWTLVITRDESSASHGKTTMRGNVVPTNATQVNIELGQQKPNLYRWQRVGNKLILHANAEPNRDRKAVLVGSWVKRGG